MLSDAIILAAAAGQLGLRPGVAADADAARALTEHWTLALDGTGAWPWRIAATGVPAH